MDLNLQSHVQTLPSYLQDTTAFLKKQEALGPIPPDALLVSMDVTSLYTNIPHSDGIKACEEAWEERDIKDPPTQTLVKVLTLVLKCNNFEFNGQYYLQVQGTAMGTKWHQLTQICLWVVLKSNYNHRLVIKTILITFFEARRLTTHVCGLS